MFTYLTGCQTRLSHNTNYYIRGSRLFILSRSFEFISGRYAASRIISRQPIRPIMVSNYGVGRPAER